MHEKLIALDVSIFDNEDIEQASLLKTDCIYPTRFFIEVRQGHSLDKCFCYPHRAMRLP